MAPRPHYRTADVAPSGAFFLFTLLGIGFIVGSKLLQVHPALVILGPLLLMATYAVLVLFATRLRLRDDQTGDNFYYMGFIFTLASLAVSLYQYSGGANVDEIVRNFGVAVSSTIMGIACRIFFNQIRRDPIEVEHVSRLELAEAARRVRRELDGTLRELAHFRRTNQQMIEEAFHELHAKVAESAAAMLSQMENFTREANEKLARSAAALDVSVDLGTMRTRFEEATASIRSLNSALADSTAGVSAAAKSATEKLEAMAMPDKVIEVTMKPAVDGLNQAISVAIDKLDIGIGELKRLRRDVRRRRRRSAKLNWWPFGRAVKKAAEQPPAK